MDLHTPPNYAFFSHYKSPTFLTPFYSLDGNTHAATNWTNTDQYREQQRERGGGWRNQKKTEAMPVGKTKPLTNFDGSNTQATSLEYHPDAAGRHTLSQSAHHTSSYHNILHLSFLALRTPSSNTIVATVQASADARDTMAASCGGKRLGVERCCRHRHRACSSSPIEILKRGANQFGTELTRLPPIEISN